MTQSIVPLSRSTLSTSNKGKAWGPVESSPTDLSPHEDRARDTSVGVQVNAKDLDFNFIQQVETAAPSSLEIETMGRRAAALGPYILSHKAGSVFRKAFVNEDVRRPDPLGTIREIEN